jgi:putative ABC transport system permease protein
LYSLRFYYRHRCATIGWSNGVNSFANHINLSWWMIAAGAILTMAITVFTVSYPSIKAALANPVESLRNE